MAEGLRQVAGLADRWVRSSKVGASERLRVERVRVPLGVIGIIYENRPNVTSDAAGFV